MEGEEYKLVSNLEVLKLEHQLLSELDVWGTDTGGDAIQRLYWIEGVIEMAEAVLDLINVTPNHTAEGADDLFR